MRFKTFLISFIVAFLLITPMLILGRDSFVVIHDNLDGDVPARVLLAKGGYLFSSGDDVLPQLMNGMPRNNLFSGLNLVNWLYFFFDPFTAYLLNKFIVHLVALIGMQYFLSSHIFKDSKSDLYIVLIIWFASIGFSILPFYSTFGLSVAGVPLVFFAFMNIIKADTAHPGDYLILALFPLYSSLVLSGMFLVIALVGWTIYYFIQNRGLVSYSVLKRAIAGVAILVTGYLIVEYNLISSLVSDQGFISIRSAWDITTYSPLQTVLQKAKEMFLHGRYHAASLHEKIFWLSLLALMLSLITCNRHKLIGRLLIIQMGIALFFGFVVWDAIFPYKEIFPVLKSITLGRFHYLSPFIWYVLMAVSLQVIYESISRIPFQYFKLIGLVIICAFSTYQTYDILRRNQEFNLNFLQVIKGNSESKNYISFNQFYSEATFSAIDKYIDLPKDSYRVASIGIHPGIALYNGFYTLDFYYSNYPLAYKHQFRQIIASELEKNVKWKNYFDSVGIRCYILVDEIPDFLSTKQKKRVIQNLDLDITSFKAMGGRYIFSAAKILNPSQTGLKFLRSFDDSTSAWIIYLYEVN